MDDFKKLQDIFDDSNKIVFFTGAGVSTESGIPDFRSANGIYNSKYKLPAEMIVSHSYFITHPKDFYDFYKEKMVYPDAIANQAHLKMAEFEEKGKCLGVITQNIDGLHQKAGSKKVCELHGTIYQNYCTKCAKKYDLDTIVTSEDIPTCDCGGIIKPNVVLYEEALDEGVIYEAVKMIEEADCLVITGTSLLVYPAAGLVDYFKGKHLVVINLSSSKAENKATLVINDKVAKVLSQIKVR